MALTQFFARILTDYDNPRTIGVWFRRQRIKALLEIIDKVYEEHRQVNIIDVGGTRTYWKIIPKRVFIEKSIIITIVNKPGLNVPTDEGHFKYAEGDGCNLEGYEDNSFHISHSNSVIEHVGDWQRMVEFANTIKRLAPNYFIQTPNYWFPVEPHFMCPLFHWLPEPVRVAIILRISLGHCKRQDSVDQAVRVIQGSRLLDKKMFSSLFSDAEISIERALLFPKSLVALRAQDVV